MRYHSAASTVSSGAKRQQQSAALDSESIHTDRHGRVKDGDFNTADRLPSWQEEEGYTLFL